MRRQRSKETGRANDQDCISWNFSPYSFGLVIGTIFSDILFTKIQKSLQRNGGFKINSFLDTKFSLGNSVQAFFYIYIIGQYTIFLILIIFKAGVSEGKKTNFKTFCFPLVPLKNNIQIIKRLRNYYTSEL